MNKVTYPGKIIRRQFSTYLDIKIDYFHRILKRPMISLFYALINMPLTQIHRLFKDFSFLLKVHEMVILLFIEKIVNTNRNRNYIFLTV